jgi:hypothetical protein
MIAQQARDVVAVKDRDGGTIDPERGRHAEHGLRPEVTDNGTRVDLPGQRPHVFLRLWHDNRGEREVLDVFERRGDNVVLEAVESFDQIVGKGL